MLQMQAFARDDPLPSWIMNALTKALSVLANQFVLVQTDATHVQLPAGAGDQAAVIAIGGMWRWAESPITVAHPGGAAGAYPIFATAKRNQITNSPAPFTDNTDYSLALQILAPGATPAIVAGTVDVYRHVGDAIWSGTAITRIDQSTPVTPLHAGRHAAGGPDPITPAAIGATPAGDAATFQTGDFISSGATSRIGAVLCDGAAYSRTDPVYAPLFAKIGTRYGAGDGATTFNVPDFRDRSIVGASATRALGTSGGASTVTVAPGNLPPHVHHYDAQTDMAPADGLGRHAPVQDSVTDPIWAGALGSGGGGNVVPYLSAGWVADSGLVHQHHFSGDTGNGPGTSTPIGIYHPYTTANIFIKL